LSESSTPFRLRGIQCLRAFAAFLVLLQHSTFFAGQTMGLDMLSFRHLQVGTYGVSGFFMISGFVMAIQTGQPAIRFAMHRLFRIYPGCLLAMAADLLILVLFRPGAASDLRFDFSIFLLPTGALARGINVPYWSLIYEMVFYCLLFIMILFRFTAKQYSLFMLAWSGAILLGPMIGITSSFWIIAGPGTILFSPFNLFFIGGFLLFGALQRRQQGPFILWLILILADFFWRGSILSLFYLQVLMGCGALLALASLWPNLSWPGFLARLGDWSYGFYLMHLSVVVALYDVLKQHNVGFWPAFAILLSAGFLGGSLFGALEHRLYRNVMRPWADRLSSAPVPATA
jgi:peptidoglycan/LPS O-acetylase OafA/YrhL